MMHFLYYGVLLLQYGLCVQNKLNEKKEKTKIRSDALGVGYHLPGPNWRR